MVGERTNEGWELRLRSRGVGRYVSAAFLAFWLCMWAIGESFVLWFLIVGAMALMTGRPPEPGREPLDPGPTLIAGLFLLVWLTMWTVGGIAAILELLRLLWGEDRITVASGRLTVTWARGIFRKTRRFERDAIRRIALVGTRSHLVLATAGERVELSGLGSPAERAEGASFLRSELGIHDAVEPTGHALPKDWEEIITPEGERALVQRQATRRAQARFAGAVTMGLAAVTVLLARAATPRLELLIPAFILFAFTVALAAGTLWLARGRWEWRIGSGRLTLRKRYGARVRDVFEGRRLLIESSNDSDGDTWYELLASGDAGAPEARARAAIRWRGDRPPNCRTVTRVMDDSAPVHELGAWLARETGLELEDRTTPRAREVQLAELLAALESTGRFGKWTAKLIGRLDPSRKKAG